jgi:hypothetical protein
MKKKNVPVYKYDKGDVVLLTPPYSGIGKIESKKQKKGIIEYSIKNEEGKILKNVLQSSILNKIG